MTQKERQERSKNEIFKASMEEFGTRNYDEVTIESICKKHNISKGMMYHYYSSKDELFLLCVQDTFTSLEEYIKKGIADLSEQNLFDAIRNFFLLREYFFQIHPKRKNIFENAMLRPPKKLTEQINSLREPIRIINWQFLNRILSNMKLRSGLDIEKVACYMESIEPVFHSIVMHYQTKKQIHDIHSLFVLVEDILDMLLLGILQQAPQDNISK